MEIVSKPGKKQIFKALLATIFTSKRGIRKYGIKYDATFYYMIYCRHMTKGSKSTFLEIDFFSEIYFLLQGLTTGPDYANTHYKMETLL